MACQRGSKIPESVGSRKPCESVKLKLAGADASNSWATALRYALWELLKIEDLLVFISVFFFFFFF